MIQYHSFRYNFDVQGALQLYSEGFTWLMKNISNRPECYEPYHGSWSTYHREYIDIDKIDLPWYSDFNNKVYNPVEQKMMMIVTVNIKEERVAMVYKLMGFQI